MPQSVQAKPEIVIFEELTCKMTFVIPEDLMPTGYPRLPIFKGDDVAQMISLDEHPDLHHLVTGIMECDKVDHLTVSRFRKQTKFEVQLTSQISNGVRGRIDALIRTREYDPKFR